MLAPYEVDAERERTGETYLTIIYTGRLAGEIEPCGCTAEGDLGGIRRLATVVDRLREKDDDAMLIGSGDLLGTVQPAHRVSNEFILKGLAHLDYEAIALHWGDLIYGADGVSNAPLPWVASNWLTDDIAPARLIDKGGVSVVFLNWLAPERSPYRELPPEHEPVTDDRGELRRMLDAFRQRGVVRILNSFGMDTPLDRLPLELIDVLLLPGTGDEYAAPRRVADTWVLQPGTRGLHVAQARFARRGDGGWDLRSHRVISLDESVPDSPRLDAWYEAYSAALNADFERRAVRAELNREHGRYLGVDACKGCHDRQIARWRTTEHAGAFAALVAVDKDHDANCVVCHSVGFGQVGGFHSARAIPDLRGVSCEACHGPSREHVESGGGLSLEPVTEAVCARCHDRAHSPGFDVASDWSRAKH